MEESWEFVFRVRDINGGVAIVDVDGIWNYSDVYGLGTAVLNLKNEKIFKQINSNRLNDEDERDIEEELQHMMKGLRETLGYKEGYTAD